MMTVIGGKNYTRNELLALIGKIEAIVYARVSTADQAKHGYSLESQVERCVELAKKKFGYNEGRVMVITEPGESGDNPDRPGMNHALFLLENGVGKKIIMLHPDRMSRFLKLQNVIADRIWGSGCDIEFVETPEVDPNNPESMLFFNLQGSIAQYNKAKILANSRRGRMTKAKNGKIPGLRRLYGYTFDKELDTLVINPTESEIYLLMVDWYLNGDNGKEMTCSGIARELATRGVPAPGGGDKWHQAVVSRILRRECYTGKFYYGRSEVKQTNGKKIQVPKPKEEWICISIPKIIDEDTYQALQEKMTGREKRARGRQSDNYLVKGIARCGRCGSAIIAGPPTTLKGGRKLRYYTCCQKTRKSFKVGTGEKVNVCYGRSWRQDVVDEYVWSFLESHLNDPDAIIADIIKQQQDIKKIDELNKKKMGLEKTISEKREEEGRCLSLYIKGLIKSEERLESMVRPIQEQIQHLQEEVFYADQSLQAAKTKYNELQAIKDSINEYRDILESEKMEFETKRAFVRMFISKVTLKENQIEIVAKWKPDIKIEKALNNQHSIVHYSQEHGGLP
ncbi:recombinase family protein [Pelotomaculum terephthalicicum]|uniref:recombinase family protein n=1 Tax=Pelotomaculum terephthalicicum TaxID=206393 RepID=UPI0028A0C252|nr:recombinase family protein [Pelotomaculum terephthalicicum]